MSSRLYWIEKPHVLGAEYSGIAAESDVEPIMQQSLEIVQSDLAYFLFDLRHLESSSADLLMKMSRMGALRTLVNHPNTCWIVFVGADPMARFYTGLLAPHKVKLFATRDQAVAFLRERLTVEVVAELAG